MNLNNLKENMQSLNIYFVLNVTMLLGLLVVAAYLAFFRPTPQPKVVIQQQECPAAPAPTGCDADPKLTNAQIIAETHTCESAGLKAEALHCGENYMTTDIQCVPKEPK